MVKNISHLTSKPAFFASSVFTIKIYGRQYYLQHYCKNTFVMFFTVQNIVTRINKTNTGGKNPTMSNIYKTKPHKGLCETRLSYNHMLTRTISSIDHAANKFSVIQQRSSLASKFYSRTKTNRPEH